MAYTQCSQINAGINARCDTSMGGIIEVAIANYDPAIFTLSTNNVSANVEAPVAWYVFSVRQGAGSMTSTHTGDDANGVSSV